MTTGFLRAISASMLAAAGAEAAADQVVVPEQQWAVLDEEGSNAGGGGGEWGPVLLAHVSSGYSGRSGLRLARWLAGLAGGRAGTGQILCLKRQFAVG